MLKIDHMQKLRDAYFPYSDYSESDAMMAIGNPSRDTIIDSAVEGMSSPDRNVRVLMLRVLAAQSGETAMRGILAGLNDVKRRVRTVAIKSCQNYLEFPEITDRLKAIVIDECEKRKIRGQALSALAGDEGRLETDISETASEALEALGGSAQYRFQILFGLVRLDLTERVEDLLKSYVANGTKAEAVMATRALCGYRVVHIGNFEDNPQAQQHIKQTCEIAHGRMFYWITRAEYARLTR